MMQETGKINTSSNDILSIQMQMNGLSFYYNNEDKYLFNQVKDSSGEIESNIEEEIKNSSCDIINMYHNGNYIIIPTPLFNEDMCESYLRLKGYTIDGGSELEKDKFITYFTSGEFTYISIFSKSIYSILEKSAKIVNIIPVIERAISYDKDLASNNISIILSGDFMHTTRHLDNELVFCESLPLESSSDLDLFLNLIVQKVSNINSLEIVVLYEPEDSNLEKYFGQKYKIKDIPKCNYFTI